MWNYDQPGHPDTVLKKLVGKLRELHPEPKFLVAGELTGGRRYDDVKGKENKDRQVRFQIEIEVVEPGKGPVYFDYERLREILKPIVDPLCDVGAH